MEDDFEILDKDTKDEDISWLWGGTKYFISKETIEALLNGNKIYNTINDEYAFTIELLDEKNK